MQNRGKDCCGEERAGQAQPCCGLPAGGQEARPCCGPGAAPTPPDSDRPYVTGYIDTPAGRVPTVATRLTAADRRGNLRARWGIGRMRYRVEPGLYAVGSPDAASPVLVTANYKLTFDYLRRELTGLDAYIMVVDTRGINVWCAAGKGTFGTAEVATRVRETRLEEIVNHRSLILPQLSATGVAAHEVREAIGLQGDLRTRPVG